MLLSSPALRQVCLSSQIGQFTDVPPAPFAGLLLADYGATILRIDRPSVNSKEAPTHDLLTRHKSSIVLDLKRTGAVALLRKIIKNADILIDPYRPVTLEALGLHTDELIRENPRLIIARLIGFRRDGKYKDMAGHDINYLAVSGVLSQLGRKGAPPYPPANVLADFAGGGLTCALGILLALIKRTQTGKGQIVEANMVDGSAFLGTFMRLARKTPLWNMPRGENLLDGGCPWYNVYKCKDGGFMAVGALEEKFFVALMDELELEYDFRNVAQDRDQWPEMRTAIARRFRERTRAEWESVFDGKDACCTPVLNHDEMEDAGYEQRSAVGLVSSPGLHIPKSKTWRSDVLAPGAEGEEVLRNWMGWRAGRDYHIDKYGLTSLERAKV